MYKRRIIQQTISLFLLLLFMVKSIGGLMLHNHYHEGKNPHNPLASHHAIVQSSGATDYCVDEFLQPFTGAEPAFILPAPGVYIAYTILNVPEFRCAHLHSVLLRGPPAMTF